MVAGRALGRDYTPRRAAIFILAVLALLIVGIMVETYWDCRTQKHGSMRDCLPPIAAL